jgi:hypothetical protein
MEPEAAPEQSKFGNVMGVTARLQQQYQLERWLIKSAALPWLEEGPPSAGWLRGHGGEPRAGNVLLLA